MHSISPACRMHARRHLSGTCAAKAGEDKHSLLYHIKMGSCLLDGQRAHLKNGVCEPSDRCPVEYKRREGINPSTGQLTGSPEEYDGTAWVKGTKGAAIENKCLLYSACDTQEVAKGWDIGVIDEERYDAAVSALGWDMNEQIKKFKTDTFLQQMEDVVKAQNHDGHTTGAACYRASLLWEGTKDDFVDQRKLAGSIAQTPPSCDLTKDVCDVEKCSKPGRPGTIKLDPRYPFTPPARRRNTRTPIYSSAAPIVMHGGKLNVDKVQAADRMKRAKNAERAAWQAFVRCEALYRVRWLGSSAQKSQMFHRLASACERRLNVTVAWDSKCKQRFDAWTTLYA